MRVGSDNTTAFKANVSNLLNISSPTTFLISNYATNFPQPYKQGIVVIPSFIRNIIWFFKQVKQKNPCSQFLSFNP